MSKPSCSSNQHEHAGLCCDRCPKGKYVLSDCSSTVQTKCETCSHGMYAASENYLHKCLQCSQCESSNQRVLKACAADSDTQCECAEGFYCSERSQTSHCQHCRPLTRCQPEHGVTKQPSKNSDTQCSLCQAGTFNNVTDYQTSCIKHTRCEDLGRALLTPGTKSSDTVCGELISHCGWMLPAGLWAGLVITALIIVVAGLLYWRIKRKSAAVHGLESLAYSVTLPSKCSKIYSPPELPPDIIKHPGSPDLHKLTQIDEICTSRELGCLECDGMEIRTMTLFEKFGPSATPLMFGPSTLQSEPQEDEWPGA